MIVYFVQTRQSRRKILFSGTKRAVVPSCLSKGLLCKVTITNLSNVIILLQDIGSNTFYNVRLKWVGYLKSLKFVGRSRKLLG